MITLYIILGVIIWYVIGLLSLVVGNLLLDKRTTITLKDCIVSCLGVLVFAALILYTMIDLLDKKDWNKEIFDFGKKK